MNIKSKIPTLITLLNGIFGLFAIINAIEEEYSKAAFFLILAVLADYFDGKLARRFGKETVFGKELDSLADIVSFGVAPIVFAYTLGFIETTSIFVLIVFLVCGMIRLARFNITNYPHFNGMPITMNGIIVPIVYFIAPNYLIHVMLISAFLMVSAIRFPKIGKRRK